MKLAEALLLRADRNRSLEQLKQRIQVSARYQEGENPPEEARDLAPDLRHFLRAEKNQRQKKNEDHLA